MPRSAKFVARCQQWLSAALLASLVAASGVARSSTADRTPVLVELFTSEGCSSCPAADALLGTLDSTQPFRDAQLIVLEEHVDYWDDLGWRDPFSSHALTERQSEYVSKLHLETGPYTPQMVVDGSEAFVGSNRTRAARAFERAARWPKVTMEISSLDRERGKLFARISTAAVPQEAELFVAVALDRAQSQVLRGENGGRQLRHVAVVRRLSNVGRLKKGESFSKDVTIDLAFSGQGEAERIVAFLAEAGSGRVLGAREARVP
ncbi:MAG: DUF1223 domain-containing protein [Acidobacteria bacterium]|nr:DUF1223 domain-containing protein [Acidobacteriota bacterium]